MAGYVTYTLTQIETQLAERYDGRIFWSSDQARRAINEAMRVWNVLVGQWRTLYTFASLPNDPYVPLTGGVFKALRVKYNGTALNLSSLNALDARFPNWRSTSGTPFLWAPVSLTTVVIYPMDAVGGTTITVDAYSPAPILVAAGDFINIGAEELSTLLGYALHVLSQSLGVAALTSTRPQYVQFMKAAAVRNEYFANSSFYRKLIGLDRMRFGDPARTLDAATIATAGAGATGTSSGAAS
jgi:hypothetical protein